MIPFKDYTSWFNQPALAAGFSYRNQYGDSYENRTRLTEALQLEKENLVYLKQVHSASIQWAEKPGLIPNSDGVLSESKKWVLSIQVADCIPVFLFDSDNRIGLVHAGWRGLTSGILPAALQEFHKHGSDLRKMKVILGPAICTRHFEIGSEIRSKFDPEFVIEKDSGLFVDLKGFARKQLMDQGVHSDLILSDTDCTWENDAQYYSYRKEGDKAGRMFAVMGWQYS